MRPVTPRFLDAVRDSHGMAARARVVAPGLTGTNPGPLDAKGNPVNEVPIIAGDVKLDATADVRGSLDLTTPADWPDSTTDLLTPYGNELFVERGIAYGDGSIEWVSQGYFRIYDVDQDEAPDGVLRISGKDRMAGITDARPVAPRSFPAGASVGSVFDDLVGEVYPDAVIAYDFNAAATLFPDNHVMDDDRYKFLKDIADSFGKVMYWDYAGVLQVRTAPSPDKPVFDVTHGHGGVLVKLSRSLSRESIYNAVVATGEAPGENQPVRAVAYDLNPDSPTYWNGPFGKVPTFYSSTFITTTDQAATAARAKLERVIGLPYNVNFQAVPNVALEPLDPVRVSYSDSKPPESHVIDTLTIPLDAGSGMSATTRKQITGGIG
ncbi:DUF5047 domain-containing protein [Amycolatopsis jejuensis]|uniref:DUF5047 domain-containing protein n=1 Tax=Amycolatopsis jejuensis TaxID=330084 RepID=UPI000524E44E|nr:DUF5047 domain-containing protein [Amycolatopsis jejuensis]